MLSDRMRQLLTAYVDGELTDRQREAATRLLEQSAEARVFVIAPPCAGCLSDSLGRSSLRR